jgi:GT2 family glycosyltransferase
MSESLVSIVVPAWNNLALNRQCVRSVYAATAAGSYELIVVDNGSTDGSREFFLGEERAGRLRVVCNPANLGFARACNLGAAQARGEHLLFLNNDTIALPGWLDAMAGLMDADPAVGIVGPKLLYDDGQIQHAGVAFDAQRRVLHIYRRLHAAHPAVNKQREFQAVTGACMLIRRELFERVGPFDEQYLNGIEDLDLCMRVSRDGRKIVYCPASVLYHLESKTPGRFEREAENARRFLSLWHGAIRPDDLDYYAQDGIALVSTDLARHGLSCRDTNENPFWREAKRLAREGLHAEAGQSFLEALRFNPYDVRIVVMLEQLGDLYVAAHDLGAAEGIYAQVAPMAPKPGLYRKLSDVQKGQGKFEEAAATLRLACA